jgi:hypothetical protein
MKNEIMNGVQAKTCLGRPACRRHGGEGGKNQPRKLSGFRPTHLSAIHPLDLGQSKSVKAGLPRRGRCFMGRKIRLNRTKSHQIAPNRTILKQFFYAKIELLDGD